MSSPLKNIAGFTHTFGGSLSKHTVLASNCDNPSNPLNKQPALDQPDWMVSGTTFKSYMKWPLAITEQCVF